MKKIIRLLAFALFSALSFGQGQAPPSGYVQPVSLAAQGPNGAFAYLGVNASGALITTPTTGILAQIGGFVQPTAPVAQDSSGNWHYMLVDATGSLKISGGVPSTSTPNLCLLSTSTSGTAVWGACSGGGGGTAVTVNAGGALGSANLQNGTNTTITNPTGANYQYNVATATSGALGVVQPDGTIITVSGGAITVAQATSSAFGVIKPDGTIITVTGGVITVAKGSATAFGVVEAGSGITATAGVLSLTNNATTVNSQSCALGSPCTIPFQTNSVNNTSQAGLNLSPGTGVGLTITPTNTGTNVETFVASGSSYTGNAATATLAATATALASVTGYSVYGSGASTGTWITPTANGQCLMSGVSSYATTTPSFQSCPAGGGSVNVNGSSVASPNFNAITPAAGSNGYNVTWQVSSSSVSAEVVGDGNSAHFLNGAGAFAAPSGSAFTPQTNGTNNATLTGINFLNSTTNASGLTITASNPGTTQEKFEITTTGEFLMIAGTTGGASANIPSGVAPTSPIFGDLWDLSGVLQFYNGTTNDVVLTTGLANTQIVVATGTNTTTSYSGLTTDSSGDVTMASATISNPNPGFIALGQGTTAWGVGTTSVGLTAPTSVTSYNLVVPSAASAGTNASSGNFYLKFGTTQNQTGCTASSTELCGYLETNIDLAHDVGATITPIANGGTNAATAANALISLFPTASEVGDLVYCATYSSGCTSWALLAGNTSGTKVLQETSAGVASWVAQSGAVSSVSNSDGTLTISPTTGAVVASIALGHANTWTATQTFPAIVCGVLNTTACIITGEGGTSGSATLTWPAVAGTASNPIVSSNNLSAPVHIATATTNQFVTGAASNLTTLNFPASSGAVTLTFPITTEYMIGAASDTTTSHVLHATAVAGIGAFSAIATGDLPTGIPNANLANSAITIGGTSVSLGGSTASFPSPGAIGGTTPSTGAFTTLTGTSSATLGTNGGTGGSVVINGSTSGSATINASSTGVLALPSGTTATSMALTTPVLGTPTSGTITNLTGTCTACNINGTVGATTPTSGSFTTLSATAVVTFTPAARTSGVAPYFQLTIPTDTGLTAATEAPGFQTVTATRTWATTGTVATQREYLFVAPTYASASASQTFTNAATVAISGAPIAGTNAIITNPSSLWVQAGMTQLDGGWQVNGTTYGLTSSGVLTVASCSGCGGGSTVTINNVISATGAITPIALGNNSLSFTCALTSGTTCENITEATASTTSGAVNLQIGTLTTSTAIPLQITQGAAGPSAANAPAIINVAAAAAGGAASGTSVGFVGAPIALLTGAGSAASTTGAGGAGGAFTVTEGNGGNGAGAASNGGAGGGLAWTLGTGGTAGTTTGAGGIGGGFTITGAAGGTSTSASGFGGVGSTFAFTSGVGGADTSAGGTGGVGGAFNITTGNGGASNGTATNAAGGSITFTLGKAGIGGTTAIGAGGEFIIQGTAIASLASATLSPNAGTIFNIAGLTGGANSNASGTAGSGSIITLITGAGGAGTGTNSVGGVGGAFNITAGAGGASLGSGANANGGSIVITPGAAGSGGSGTAGLAGVVSVLGQGAGFMYLTQGTAITTSNTNIPSNSIIDSAPTAVTAYTNIRPGTAAQGIAIGALSGSTITQGYSGDTNHSATVSTSTATSVGSTSLCSTTFCPAGTYRVSAYIDVTTACSTTGAYLVSIIYTDDTTVSKTVVMPLIGTGVTATLLGPTANSSSLAESATTNFGEGSMMLRSTGASSINYSTTATACGTGGPGLGKLYLVAEPIQ